MNMIQENLEANLEDSLSQENMESPVDVEVVENLNDNLNHSDVVENALLAEVQKPEVETAQFSLNDIVYYLQRKPLRQTWCWMEKKMQNDHCIILMQIDSYKLKIQLVLKIHQNLTVTIHTSDDKVIIEFPRLITSTRKIEKLLNFMENNMILCQ